MSQVIDRPRYRGEYDEELYWERVDRSLGWLGDTPEEQRARQERLKEAVIGVAGVGGIGGAVALRLVQTLRAALPRPGALAVTDRGADVAILSARAAVPPAGLPGPPAGLPLDAAAGTIVNRGPAGVFAALGSGEWLCIERVAREGREQPAAGALPAGRFLPIAEEALVA